MVLSMPVLQKPDPAILDANIEALAGFCRGSVDVLRSAGGPDSVAFTAGRDGTPTYVWTDGGGRTRWLGRTSMPSVSSTELVDAFQPGSHNVLFDGFGQGAEVELLLGRLAPHQAVMTVDRDAWAVALSLGLYDFSEDLRRGRLLVFVGADAWTLFHDFLIEHDGFLTPERVLSWPWFDAESIASVSDRVAAIGADVATRRAARHAERRAARSALQECRPVDEPVIAVLSNVAEARTLELGRHVLAGAEVLGWRHRGFMLDSPTMVHPYAVEAAMHEVSPTLNVLVDTPADGMQYELPAAASLVVRSDSQPLTDDWLKRLSSGDRLAVPTARQTAQAVEFGLDPARVVTLPAAAAVGLRRSGGGGGGRVVVAAAGADVSAKAVGLHLGSHKHMWETATGIVESRCDAYVDDDAEGILAEALRRLRVKMDSAEVREGLVARIRQVLGLVLVRRAYCLALVEAGVKFDLYGGWDHDDVLRSYDRGGWPGPLEIGDVLADGGMVVSIEPSGHIHQALLDGVAAGLAGMVRRHALDDTPDGLGAVLNPGEHVWRFDTRASLVELVRRYQAGPEGFRQRAAAAAEHVNAEHTWASRVEAMVRACRLV